MSLTNEQRAHDYAICVLHEARKENSAALDESGDEDAIVDMFDLYLDIYNRSLEKLNKMSK